MRNLITWTGADHIAYNVATVQSLNSSVVVGIAAGNEADIAAKIGRKANDPNEDALAVFQYDDGSRLYVVADGRFGDQASRLAVAHVGNIVEEQLKRTDPKRALYNTMFALDEHIGELRSSEREDSHHGPTQTTLLAVLESGDAQYFASIGDPSLYLIQKREVQELNLPDYETRGCTNTPILIGSNWNMASLRTNLGDQAANSCTALRRLFDQWNACQPGDDEGSRHSNRVRARFVREQIGPEAQQSIDYAAMAPFIFVGEIALPRDATLLLATDGIQEEASGISLSQLAAIFQGDLRSGMDTLFDTVKDGKDNTATIAIRHVE